MTVATDGNENLNALTEYALSHPRLKQFDSPINEAERDFLRQITAYWAGLVLLLHLFVLSMLHINCKRHL